ncbi:MAG: hypothetical protein AB1941_19175 [Gemmatimonadota bacterium]
MVSTTRSLNDVAAAGGDLWVVLWQALGDVWLWSDVPQDQRGELFGPSSREARERALRARREVPQLTESLGTFHLLRSAPQVLDAPQVAEACARVARWAEEESLIELAAYFAEGAAVVDPEDPARANEAARLCRRASLNPRAVVWYERAFKLAVRAQSRREIVGALLGYGALLYGLGFYDRARPYFERVARFAVRTGRRRTAAEAHHDLMAVSADGGDLGQAAEHARLAESYYPLHHPRLPYLVHDCAVLLVHLHHYTPALPLVRRLPPYFPRPEEATLVWSTAARAAGGAAQPALNQEAERRTLELLALYEEHAAAALVSLSHGARALGDDARATRFAHLAVEIAKRRKERGEVQRAREVLMQIERKEPAPEEAPAPEELAALARRLAARLRMWKRRDPQAPPALPGGDPPG